MIEAFDMKRLGGNLLLLSFKFFCSYYVIRSFTINKGNCSLTCGVASQGRNAIINPPNPEPPSNTNVLWIYELVSCLFVLYNNYLKFIIL